VNPGFNALLAYWGEGHGDQAVSKAALPARVSLRGSPMVEAGESVGGQQLARCRADDFRYHGKLRQCWDDTSPRNHFVPVSRGGNAAFEAADQGSIPCTGSMEPSHLW
jgi:hypothetical protein